MVKIHFYFLIIHFYDFFRIVENDEYVLNLK